MRSSTFKWGYCVLPDSLVPVSQKKELVDSKQTQDVQKNSPLLTHTHWCALTIYIWSVFYEGTRPWLTWLHVCCRLPCDRHSARLFSSSTWWTRSSCHTAAPGWAGSPGNPLKQREMLCELMSKEGRDGCGVVFLTSDFADGLSGIPTHYGKRHYSVVLTTLQKRRGEEASGAHVSWMGIPLDYMLTQVLL